MKSVLVVIVLLAGSVGAWAQTVWPECPASAQCVLMVPPDFLALSAADGASLGFAVAGVWAVAWGIKVLTRLVPTVSQADE